MARTKKGTSPDLSQRYDLTAGAIERLACPEGKAQAFLRDTEAPSLRVRITSAGAKSFVFEGKLNRQTIRITIGSTADWDIAKARAEARRLAVLVDGGTDPREVKREQTASKLAQATQESARALTVGEAWERYIAERRLHWGGRTYADHLAITDAGGKPRKRMPNVLTKPAPLAPLMGLRLCDLNSSVVETWAAQEAQVRPARVRLALRMLKAFLRWAAAEADLKPMADPSAASAKKAREAAGRPRSKDDVLERGQLVAWFGHVRQLHNSVIAAYLQTLLFTGARPGEVLAMKWSDLNTQWKSITIRDKVEGERQIPLTPYVASLLDGLPRRNGWVFSGGRALVMTEANTRRRRIKRIALGEAPDSPEKLPSSASGRLVDPSIAHTKACAAAGLDGLTLHGLRRSFASLTEWLDVPAGVVAQIMGHKPSATAEKHYKRRPLDLLRVHHEKIEAWVLEQAGVEFDGQVTKPAEQRPTLQAV